MRIVSRAEWGARPAAGRPIKVPIAARTALCVHHDGAVPIVVKTFAEACALMRRDQDFHMDSRGWDDVGYNFLTVSAVGFPEIDGLIFAGRGRDVVGAHCKDKNTPWLGVQVAVGGSQKPSPAALASVSWLHNDAQAASGHTLAMVGHRDGFPTECPGAALYAWVKAGMPVPTTQGNAKPVTNSAPGKVTMLLIKGADSDKVYVTDGLLKRHVGPGEVKDLLRMTERPIMVIAQGVCDRIPVQTVGK